VAVANATASRKIRWVQLTLQELTDLLVYVRNLRKRPVEMQNSIDASKIDTSLLGANHQYFADSSSLLYDLFLFFQGTPATNRLGLTRQQNSGGAYWLFEARAR
jgi:hypothetical protein